MRGGRGTLPATLAGALALTAPIMLGCGADDGGDAERGSTGVAVADARLATNEPGRSLVGRPRRGVLEGEPRIRSGPPPAAVGSPRRNCTGGGLEPTAAVLDQVRSATLCLVNVERQTRGIRPLRANRRLARAALRHSRDMVNRSYFAHDARSGATFVDRIRRAGYLNGPRGWVVGENIAWGAGSRSRPRAIVDAWMQSPPHRANILQRSFREIGIGIVIGSPRGSAGASAATYSTAFGGRG